MKTEHAKLLGRIDRFADKVEVTAKGAINDPLHEFMYKEEMANHCIEALQLLTACKKALLK